MRPALLGDVQVRHDLQATDDGVAESTHRGRNASINQHAVDAVADGEVLFVRLDVNIGGAFAHGFNKEIIDEAHHAGFLRLRGLISVEAGMFKFSAPVPAAERVQRVACNAVVLPNVFL